MYSQNCRKESMRVTNWNFTSEYMKSMIWKWSSEFLSIVWKLSFFDIQSNSEQASLPAFAGALSNFWPDLISIHRQSSQTEKKNTAKKEKNFKVPKTVTKQKLVFCRRKSIPFVQTRNLANPESALLLLNKYFLDAIQRQKNLWGQWKMEKTGEFWLHITVSRSFAFVKDGECLQKKDVRH